MIYLDDLLREDGFHHRVTEPAHLLRERVVFPTLHQLGLVVPNVQKAAAVLETDGCGPFFIARGAPVVWQEKGRRQQVCGKMGLAYHQGVEIENGRASAAGPCNCIKNGQTLVKPPPPNLR